MSTTTRTDQTRSSDPVTAPATAPASTRTAEAPPTVTYSPTVSAAAAAADLIGVWLGNPPPVRFEFWDGSSLGPASSPGTVEVRSPDAIRRILWAPGELGVGRAYVSGDLGLRGDLFATLEALRDGYQPSRKATAAAVPAGVKAAQRLGVIGAPLAPPPEEMVHNSGWRHTRRRDSASISHHYDVGNDFYRLVLGPSMTYSCARYEDPSMTLEAAQASKHELISRKLGLADRPGARMLDVGCGWGSLAMHAAQHHGARVVGVTISKEQAARARERVAEAELEDQVEIRVQDYRDLRGEQPFDAISSVGMFEHVGSERMAEYFATLHGLLAPTGRLLNHGISSVGGSKLSNRSFMNRYVFPDGELLDVGCVVLAMERAGFEVRDVDSLRESYALTLRAWVANLEEHWDEAVALVGEPRARIWRLYMASSALGFTDGGLGLHQVLGVVPDDHGDAAVPPTRRDWV
ncbi:cyclopropane-fatty-acyl-phospholipid synthase family protein [soil metagenome]